MGKGIIISWQPIQQQLSLIWPLTCVGSQPSTHYFPLSPQLLAHFEVFFRLELRELSTLLHTFVALNLHDTVFYGTP